MTEQDGHIHSPSKGKFEGTKVRKDDVVEQELRVMAFYIAPSRYSNDSGEDHDYSSIQFQFTTGPNKDEMMVWNTSAGAIVDGLRGIKQEDLPMLGTPETRTNPATGRKYIAWKD